MATAVEPQPAYADNLPGSSPMASQPLASIGTGWQIPCRQEPLFRAHSKCRIYDCMRSNLPSRSGSSLSWEGVHIGKLSVGNSLCALTLERSRHSLLLTSRQYRRQMG